MPPLHLPTLFVATAVVIAFAGVLLIATRGRDRNTAPLALWGTAMLVGAAGIVTWAVAPEPRAVFGQLGNAAILTGTALAWTAARVFCGRSAHPFVAAAGPVACLVLLVLSTRPNSSFAATLLGSIYTAAAAGELWRSRAEPLPSRAAAILVLLLHASIHGGRVIVLAVAPAAQWPVSDGTAAFLMFEALLHTVAMAFLLLAMMKERAELETVVQLNHLLMQDGLTGLGNRRRFDEALDSECRRALRSRASIALLMIDVDHFKRFNDHYGHQAGDDALRGVACAIRAAVHRPGDVAVRYGGEEFAVLLANTDEAGALVVADTIHRGVAALATTHQASPLGRLGVSIGIAAEIPHEGSAALVRRADEALYAAKGAGRNRSVTNAGLARPAPTLAADAPVTSPATPMRARA